LFQAKVVLYTLVCNKLTIDELKRENNKAYFQREYKIELEKISKPLRKMRQNH